jgi:hypothetical protein
MTSRYFSATGRSFETSRQVVLVDEVPSLFVSHPMGLPFEF